MSGANPPCICRSVTVVGSVCVCVSVKSHLTSGASVHPENSVMYSTGNGGQKNCGAPLQGSSTPSIESHKYSQPFSSESMHAHYSIYHIVSHEAAFRKLPFSGLSTIV